MDRKKMKSQLDGWIDRKNRRITGWIYKMYGSKEKKLDEWLEGYTIIYIFLSRWMVGRKDNNMKKNRWMGGWIEKQKKRKKMMECWMDRKNI